MSTKNLPTTVWIAFIAVCFFWGTTYLGIKIAMQYFPPFWFSGFRHVLAGLIFILISVLKGYSFPSRRDTLRLFVVGCFMVIGGNALLSWAEIYISSGLAGILSSMAPLFITLLSIFFFKGFRVTWVIFGGLVLSIIGILLLSKPDETLKVTEGFTLGICLTIVANLCWAFGSIFMKKYPVNAHVFMRTGVQMASAGSFNLLVGTFFEPKINFSAVPTEGWLAAAYLITFGSLVGYTCLVYLLEYMAPARVSIHVYVNTVVAVLIGWLFAGEHLTCLMVGAMAIILLGVIIVNNEYSKMAQKAAESVENEIS
jgi:drug/metabolite transporter (DMT)-like permease